jgi:hypothetical protein
VGPTTLRHYFADRTTLVLAVMNSWHLAGLPYLHAAATRPIPDVGESLAWFVAFVLEGWRLGVGAMHADPALALIPVAGGVRREFHAGRRAGKPG